MHIYLWSVSFQSIYKEPDQVSIVEVLKLTSYIPSFVNEGDNNQMMENIFKDKLKLSLPLFKREGF